MEQKKQLSKITENGLVDIATDFIKSKAGELALPPNYDYIGATKSFFLELMNVKDKNGTPALQSCTRQSIEKSLLDMISQGWDIRKKQCYLIVYGNSLTVQESYFGKQKRAKTYNRNLLDIYAQVIYQGDVFETKIETDGRKVLVKHESPFKNLNNPILGAYAVAVFSDGKTLCDVMTIQEIQRSWAMSKTGGTVHKQFPVEMCRKTVKSRLAKALVNTTDDSAILNDDLIEENNKRDDLIDINDIDENATTEEKEILADIEIDATEIEDNEDENATYSYEEIDEIQCDYVAEATDFDDNSYVEENSDEITVSYSDWLNKYKPTKEWEQVKGTYNSTNKTIAIRRIQE